MRRVWPAVFVSIALGGCSLVTDFDRLRGDGAANDAGSDVPTWDVDAAVDAPKDAPSEADAAPCDRTKPFGVPVAIAGLSHDDRNEELARFSPDLLTAWVLVRTPGINGVTAAIVELTRATTSAAFGGETDLGIASNALGTTGTSGHFGISADRLRLVHQTPLGKLVDCVRGSTSVSFGGCTTLAPDAATPFLSASGKRLTAVASLANGFLAPATLDWFANAWTAPVKIAELDVYGSPTALSHPALTTDEKTIVYDVGDQMWIARVQNGVFGPPEKLGGLSAQSSETHPSWISDDECTLALVSNRIGSMDVFLAVRPK